MPKTIAVSIVPPPVDGLPQKPLFYSVNDGAAQLYDGQDKALPASKVADGNAFLMGMHAARAVNAAELAAIVGLYALPNHEIAPVELANVTPEPIRFALADWRREAELDAASWPEDPVADEPREIVVTHDASRIILTMPVPDDHGGAISVAVELQGKRLIVHAYDPAHESPINLRIGETTILIDTHDRDAEDSRH